MNSLLPVESRPTFMALPSDPHLTTPEQEDGIWGGDVVGMLVDHARDYRASLTSAQQHPDPMTISTPVRIGAKDAS